MKWAEVITGIITATDQSGTCAPGAATYSIAWNRQDGQHIDSQAGQRTAWPYVWPSFAKVEPSRLIGQTVHGMETADLSVLWFFVEPIAGTLCGESMSAAAARLRAGGGGGGALPGGRPTPDGPPGSSEGPGGGGTA